MRNFNTTNLIVNTIIDNTIITHINNIILPSNILDNQPINQDEQHEEQIVL